MTDFDRELVDLIASLTDEGWVAELDIILDVYGSKLAERVLADGFAVVYRNPGLDPCAEKLLNALRSGEFIPQHEALALVRNREEPRDYRLAQGPWAIGLEDEPNLIFEYCADTADAVAEIRRRHAERREAWERKRETR